MIIFFLSYFIEKSLTLKYEPLALKSPNLNWNRPFIKQSLSVESSLSFNQEELSLAGQEPQASPRFADLGYGS